MQLDKTHIAIRERDILEIFDLSLHILRDYLRPLIVTLLLGALPLALLNFVLMGWMMDVDLAVQYPFRYVWCMIALVAIEAPVATVFMTAFLGQAVFDERPRISQVIGDVLRNFWRLLWCLGFGRGVIPGILLVSATSYFHSSEYWVEVIWLPLLLMAVLFTRAIRPFLVEIVILEQNPLRASDRSQMTINRRSQMLHAPSSGILFSRAIVGAFFSIGLTLTTMGAFFCLSGIFLHDWRQGPITLGVCLPAALWIVVGFFAVVRFLSYLDVRIRQEGWEVEIRLRAEAAAYQNRVGVS